MPRLVRITPSAATPVSVAEAKANMRVEHSDDDALIASLIAAATDHLDGWTGMLGRALINQTWRMFVDSWPTDRRIRLPLGPVQSIAAIQFHMDGTDTTIDPGEYWLEDGVIYPVEGYAWPALSEWGAQVDFVAGYGEVASDVPPAIRQAILLLVGHWYNSREAVSPAQIKELPFGVEALLSPYRRLLA